jgi:hypothetical protein
LLLSFSSCFEIIEELDLKKDKSGVFTYTLNMSASKLELNTMFKLDSFKGKDIPSKDEISTEMDEAIRLIKTNPGIKSASYTKNWEDYVFVFKVSFDSIVALNKAMGSTYTSLSEEKLKLKDRLLMDNGILKRISSLDSLSLFRKLNSKDVEGLAKATYTCVYRFEEKVESVSNKKAKKSKSEKAVMLRSDIKSLLNKETTLRNEIKFTP